MGSCGPQSSPGAGSSTEVLAPPPLPAAHATGADLDDVMQEPREANVPAASPLAAALAAAASAVAAAPAAVASAAEAIDPCAQELGVPDLNALIVAACVVEFIALTGAFVGGYVARQRKQELERINAQLRQINTNLRKQARVESYAPGLSYAPVGMPAAAAAAAAALQAQTNTEVKVAPAPVTETENSGSRGNGAGSSKAGKEEVLRVLREGKRGLRTGNPEVASAEFKRALALAERLGDVVEEKKAARGVGASLQRQGKFNEAITYHKRVLDISTVAGEHSGDTEAYGAIADCYTELGDLEAAAKYYDRYIARLEQEDA